LLERARSPFGETVRRLLRLPFGSVLLLQGGPDRSLVGTYREIGQKLLRKQLRRGLRQGFRFPLARRISRAELDSERVQRLVRALNKTGRVPSEGGSPPRPAIAFLGEINENIKGCIVMQDGGGAGNRTRFTASTIAR
jgi:hypothetical protein